MHLYPACGARPHKRHSVVSHAPQCTWFRPQAQLFEPRSIASGQLHSLRTEITLSHGQLCWHAQKWLWYLSMAPLVRRVQLDAGRASQKVPSPLRLHRKQLALWEYSPCGPTQSRHSRLWNERSCSSMGLCGARQHQQKRVCSFDPVKSPRFRPEQLVCTTRMQLCAAP